MCQIYSTHILFYIHFTLWNPLYNLNYLYYSLSFTSQGLEEADQYTTEPVWENMLTFKKDKISITVFINCINTGRQAPPEVSNLHGVSIHHPIVSHSPKPLVLQIKKSNAQHFFRPGSTGGTIVHCAVLKANLVLFSFIITTWGRVSNSEETSKEILPSLNHTVWINMVSRYSGVFICCYLRTF